MKTKGLLWFLLLTKRILKRPSFWAILLLVPLLTAGMALAAREDSHILRIGLYAEPSDDPLAERIIEDLENLDGVIRYEACESEEELRSKVAYSQIDAGYLLPADLTRLMEDYTAGRKGALPYGGHLVTVVANEDTVWLQLAREQFFGVLYPYFSEAIAEQFALEQEVSSDLDEADVRRSVRQLYEQTHVEESIFRFAHSPAEPEPDWNDISYLTSPVRGMLALFVLLTGLATALYLLKDKKYGVFDWVKYGQRGHYDWIYLLSGTLVGGLAAYIGLFFSGTFTDWTRELPLMGLLIFAVVGFSGLLCRIIRNLIRFATCIPLILLCSAVLCPVFATFPGLLPVKYLLPPYFYLNGLYGDSFLWYLSIYAALTNIGAFVLFREKSPRELIRMVNKK